MYGTILNPVKYQALGLRDNNYLVTAIVMLGVSLAGVLYHHRQRLTHPALSILVRSIAYAVMFAVVIVFLRPVEQFIYFQF